MESSSIRIRRWIATVVVLAAFAGGALLSQGFRNWAGPYCFWLAERADRNCTKCIARKFGQFR